MVMIASLIWLTSLSAIGPGVHLTVPGTSDGWQNVRPDLPVIPFGDDAGGSH